MRRVCVRARKGGQQTVAVTMVVAAAATTTSTMSTTTTMLFSLKTCYYSRLDSGHDDRKIRSSPPEDNIRDGKGMRKGRKRRRDVVIVDVATPFFASLSAN